MALDSRYLKPFQEPVTEVAPSKLPSANADVSAGHAGAWKHPVPMTEKEGEEFFKEFVHNKVSEDKPTEQLARPAAKNSK